MVADGPCRRLTEHMQGKPSLGLASVSSMAGQECACADPFLTASPVMGTGPALIMLGSLHQ